MAVVWSAQMLHTRSVDRVSFYCIHPLIAIMPLRFGWNNFFCSDSANPWTFWVDALARNSCVDIFGSCNQQFNSRLLCLVEPVTARRCKFFWANRLRVFASPFYHLILYVHAPLFRLRDSLSERAGAITLLLNKIFKPCNRHCSTVEAGGKEANSSSNTPSKCPKQHQVRHNCIKIIKLKVDLLHFHSHSNTPTKLHLFTNKVFWKYISIVNMARTKQVSNRFQIFEFIVFEVSSVSKEVYFICGGKVSDWDVL